MYIFFKPTKNQILLSVLGILLISCSFWLGLIIGMKVQPRSVISINKCQDRCWSTNEITGLVGSIGIELNGQKVFAVKENDNCFSIKRPLNGLKTNYTIIPKKDIKDI